MGLPSSWNQVLGWIIFCGTTIIQSVVECVPKPRKFTEIPIMKDYRCIQDRKFWDSFPSRPLPLSAETGICAETLAKLLTENGEKMTDAEKVRGKKAIDYLVNGAPSHQRKHMPPIACKNHDSAYENAPSLTDTIAQWVIGKFVSGPFRSPPVKNFRSNPLKVIVQHGKVRPVLNVSSPRGFSFNDNVIESRMEKVHMSSAARFGQSVLKAGKNAVMTKFDLKNAYKNVPCKIEDIRLQGFEWGGRYFAETTQMFGARTSVSNFDIVGNTILTLATRLTDIPRFLVHRQLDDVPVVGPENSSWCENFTETYADICQKIKVETAPDCPLKDKAFRNSRSGKVLGIEFRTENLSWKIPEEKRTEYMNDIHARLQEDETSCQDCHEILGKLNFVCSMCPAMRTFKKPLQEFLRVLEESGIQKARITSEARKDLLTWWKFLEENKDGFPIPDESDEPPLHHKTITTDAAGWKSGNTSGEIGMGSVGVDEEGEIFLATQKFWNLEKVEVFLDSKGKSLGSKTTTLEFAGILIPFLLFPEKLMNQSIVVQVDNMGCYYAWENGYSKEDMTASILVRALLLVSVKLNSRVTIRHLPRESSWESQVADRLSRERTSGNSKGLLSQFPERNLPIVFRQWMEDPIEDWDLPMKLVM